MTGVYSGYVMVGEPLLLVPGLASNDFWIRALLPTPGFGLRDEPRLTGPSPVWLSAEPAVRRRPPHPQSEARACSRIVHSARLVVRHDRAGPRRRRYCSVCADSLRVTLLARPPRCVLLRAIYTPAATQQHQQPFLAYARPGEPTLHARIGLDGRPVAATTDERAVESREGR